MRYFSALTFIFTLLLATSSQAGNYVQCPSINAIKDCKYKLNRVDSLGNYQFNVSTSTDVILKGGRYWSVAVINVAAKTPDDALSSASQSIDKMVTQVNEEAVEFNVNTGFPMYVCYYAPGFSIAFSGNDISMLPR